MSTPLLLKGFEVEMYTGRADGTVVGCSAEAAAALDGFVTEPDHRNLEYITPPDASYARQLQLLLTVCILGLMMAGLLQRLLLSVAA